MKVYFTPTQSQKTNERKSARPPDELTFQMNKEIRPMSQTSCIL
jgi:hypothetical protein